MPNHCENILTVKGSRAKEFFDACQAEGPVYKNETKNGEFGFTFHALCPVPLRILRQTYSDAGHRWQTRNWGTKWNAYDIHIQKVESDEIDVYFSTAWSPAEGWMAMAAAAFPDLRFEYRYAENGAFFVGEVVYENGKIIHSFDRHNGDDAFWAFAEKHFGWSKSAHMEDDDDEYDDNGYIIEHGDPVSSVDSEEV